MWPVKATILTGPRRSGRTLLARSFAERVGGRLFDNAETRDEEELFHAWNQAQDSGRPLIMVADTAPPEWEPRLPDLRTRLAVTPVTRIHLPDDRLFSALIQLLFADRGLHVPGDALQCVLIDKLPFPPPNDPLVEARVKRLESEGRNPFSDYFVAEAAVSLKQGAGRLIRSETDRGLLVICDPRMAGMNYGRRLREALPPMTRLTDEADALEWLAELSACALPF
jgi:hypothetical protein